ncbi:putative nuclease HARBI1 [Anastrepha obliqua]|uniref:putative nuclease HARBI1 n=2 Tax=Anastrepha TaxID=28585 RepID=UPI002409C353|nr:putative nuclease HARBI1 [Anastrepha obliqua]
MLVEAEGERSRSNMKIQRKTLRDASNPLDVEDTMFTKNYRLNKAAFLYVLSVLDGNARSMRSCSISSLQRLSSVLRFFAEGGYQHGVGKDFDIPMAQSTFCGVLKDVLHTLQCHLCPQWVNLDLSNEEKRQAKMDFYQKYGFPGAILCVDGTHIKIVAPAKDKFLYFNRKGYYSINAMIICDNKMRIRYVNAQYPGSNHDAHIWNVSSARNFFENKYLNGERNTWLLGMCIHI